MLTLHQVTGVDIFTGDWSDDGESPVVLKLRARS